MVSGVVEVVALLGSVKGGLCRSSAARATVLQATEARISLAQPRTAINAQRDVFGFYPLFQRSWFDFLKSSRYTFSVC